MIRPIELSWKRVMFGLGVIALLIVGFVLYVNVVNEVTSSRAPYVTNTSCGLLFSNGTFQGCPGAMECYDVPDRFAVGARCVEPGYVDEFCGVLTTAYRMESEPPSLDCAPVYDPVEVLKRTPRVLSATSN